MGFKKRKNKNDLWNEMLVEFKSIIDENLLSFRIFKNEKSFDKFLTDGRLCEEGKIYVKIQDIDNDQFLALEKIVNYWYEEIVGGQDHLSSFCDERVKRFNRYG